MIIQLIQAQESYVADEAYAVRMNKPLQIKSTFARHTAQELEDMTFEDLANEYNKWIIYLNVEAFEYVCVFVSDFGVPNPTDFDLESDDTHDHVKESKTIKRAIKEDMKELFQSNTRRVFITNINIAREGIDLHDTSEGGMHPRTGIISPGIVARYLIQMLGRFVRDGQTSESLRIVGYVDNVKGAISWEAKFMEKLSQKVRDIQTLHNGEVSLDILDNIDRDGKSILKSIIDDIRMGAGRSLYDEPVISSPISEINSSPISGGRDSSPAGSGLTPVAVTDVVGTFFQKTFANRSSVQTTGSMLPSPGWISLSPNPPSTNVVFELRTNNTHMHFFSRHVNLTGFITKIADILKSAGIEDIYYKIIENGKPNGPGILIYKPGLFVSGLSESDFVYKVEEVVGYPITKIDVPEGTYITENLSPAIRIANLIVVFESTSSILVSPPYPLKTLFPKSLLNSMLTMSDTKQNILRFHGSEAGAMAAYYAIKMIAKYESVGLYQNFVVKDPRAIIPTIKQRYRLTPVIRNGNYLITGDPELVKLLAVIVGTYKKLVPSILAREVFDLSSFSEYDGNMSSVRVLEAYQEFMSTFLEKLPVNEDEKK
jgi:hypothetical protein